MLLSGFIETCLLEENRKLWFPSRFERTLLLRQVFLANHYTQVPLCVVSSLLYFWFPVPRPFFSQLAKVDLSSLFPSVTSRPPSFIPTLPLCFCFHFFSLPSSSAWPPVSLPLIPASLLTTCSYSPPLSCLIHALTAQPNAPEDKSCQKSCFLLVFSIPYLCDNNSLAALPLHEK